MRLVATAVAGLLLAGGAAAGALPDAAAAGGRATLERDVLAQLNGLRADPAGYAAALRGYRGLFRARRMAVPGSRVQVQTAEGVAPLDEAVAELGGEAALPSLGAGAVLAAAAADHGAEQARSGAVGHDDADGAGPGTRALRRGGGRMVAEVIAYGPVDAAEVIRQLVIDDGVPGRGHRRLLLAPGLRYAGVACGPHPTYRTMCVIDLAATPDGREPPLRLAALGGD